MQRPSSRYALWTLIVVVLIVLGGLGGYALAKRDRPYSATAALEFEPDNLESALLGNTSPFGSETTEDQATYPLTVIRPPVVTAALHQLRLAQFSEPADAHFSAASAGNSNVVNVTATWPTPSTAIALANAIVSQFIKLQQGQMRVAIASAQRGLAAELARLNYGPHSSSVLVRTQQIESQQATLTALAAINPANARVIQRAASAARAGRSKKKLVLSGAIIGLFVGFVVVWVLDQARDRRRRLDAAAEPATAKAQPTTTLALTREGRRTPFSGRLQGVDAEQVRQLVVLYGLDGQKDRTHAVICTPARPNEAFDLAWRIAQEASEMGSHVLYGADARTADSGAADEAASTSVARVPGMPNLSTVSFDVGASASTTGGLRDLVDSERGRFDVVMVAASSVTEDANALRLARDADAVIVFGVGDADGTIPRSVALLDRVKAPHPDLVSFGSRSD
jgi:hypothetical protein